MDELRIIIGKNIVSYRKQEGLTQAGLAAKLNYTDKAVSKWERGEAIPDIETLRALSLLFGVTVDELISERKKQRFFTRKSLVPYLSCGIVWLIATIVFVFCRIFAPSVDMVWLAFVYAVPASAVILIVFFAVWRHRFVLMLSESLLIWSVALAIYLSLPIAGTEFIFLLPIPLQVMTVLWYIFKHKK